MRSFPVECDAYFCTCGNVSRTSCERSEEERSKIVSPPLFSFFRHHHVLHEKLPTYFNLAFNTDVQLPGFSLNFNCGVEK